MPVYGTDSINVQRGSVPVYKEKTAKAESEHTKLSFSGANKKCIENDKALLKNIKNGKNVKKSLNLFFKQRANIRQEYVNDNPGDLNAWVEKKLSFIDKINIYLTNP